MCMFVCACALFNGCLCRAVMSVLVVMATVIALRSTSLWQQGRTWFTRSVGKGDMYILGLN